ncbi:MAG: xylulokinase, partial [Planctomycetota bacterium]
QAACTINAEQGPAFGVALLAGVGCGQFKNIEEACKATIEVVKKTPPKRPAVKAYDKLFPVYQSLYHSLKDTYEELAKL